MNLQIYERIRSEDREGKMKKRFLLLSVVLALVLVLAGCSKPTMSVDPQEDGSLSVTCDRMYGSGVSADITVGEGQTLVFTPALEKGHIRVRIMAPATDINQLPDMENDSAYFEANFEGDTQSRVDLEPGEYSLFIATDKEKTTGTMTIVPTAVDATDAPQALGEEAPAE